MKSKITKLLQLLLLAGLLAQPLAAEAKMTLKVVTPKRNAKLTNEMITATGSVKSTVPVAGVFYSFNGGDWLSASGTTNWSVPDLPLTAGVNSFWVYAKDADNACSPTNKVTFTYMVMQPVTIEINGAGMVNPDYSGRLLQIGRSYVANAKAYKGFAFTGWTGDITNPAAHLAFIMRSNLTLIANFKDITPPSVVITSPVPRQTVSNATITATCRATDNVGIEALFYQLNGGVWETNATSTDKTNWTFGGLELTPGTNTLRAYAVDAEGNLSATNTVAFTYSVPPFTGFAPLSLAGLMGDVVEEGYPTVKVSFGPSTMAFYSQDTNDDFMAVGNYACTRIGSNTVRLSVMLLFPPNQAGVKWTQDLEFTNANTCVLTNLSDNSLARLTLTAAPNLLPSPSAILTVQHWVDGYPGVDTSVMGGGVFTNYADFGTPAQAATSWGTNVFFPFSGVAVMMMQQFADPDNAGQASYSLLNLESTTNGTWRGVSFDSGMNLNWSGTGGFHFISTANPPTGNAPMNIAGKVINVSEGGATFKVCFGDYTFTTFDADTSHENNGVNLHSYFKTGANTARLVNLSILPPYEWYAEDISVVNLTFTSANSGNVQTTSGTGSFSAATANNYAPASLAGKTITIKEAGSVIGSGVFNQDGTITFTETGGGSETMIYDYAPFSPLGGMMVVLNTDGSTTYFQLQFNNATSGSWFETDFDNLGNYVGVYSGTFTVN